MKRKHAIMLAIAWLLVMACIAVSAVTLFSGNNGPGRNHWVTREEYAIIERYDRLESVRSILEEEFYQEIDDETLMNGAIKGMLASLEDPYSCYYTPEEMTRFNEENSGEFVGIGLLVQNNGEGRIEIIRVYEGAPAHAAGIRVGDCITAVDGKAVSGISPQSLARAVTLIKGEAGSEVEISVLREGETLTFPIIRSEVSASNVSAAMIGDGIGYIDIFEFNGDAADAFADALAKHTAEGARALIIDLRNNPGGSLDIVLSIADSLLPKGTIVYTQDREGRRNDYYSDDEYCELPLVVLMNEMSASASELLAAAVQDFGRGKIIGTGSYGKGVVQTVLTYESDGAGLQYTSACYYTPSGKNIHGTGVEPDIYVEAKDGFNNFSGIPDPDNDLQLQAAIAELENIS